MVTAIPVMAAARVERPGGKRRLEKRETRVPSGGVAFSITTMIDDIEWAMARVAAGKPKAGDDTLARDGAAKLQVLKEVAARG